MSLPFVCLCVLPSVSESVSQSVSESVIYEDINGMAMAAHSGPVGILYKYHGNAPCETAEKFAKEGERERGEDEDDDRTCCKHVSYGCGKLLYLSIYRDNVTRNCAAITVKRMQKFKYSRAREDNWGRTSNETSREI